MAGTFLTVPDEVLGLAELAEAHFRGAGYTVRIEQAMIDLPGTPTLTLRRSPATQFVLVRKKIDQKEADIWVRYCRSRTTDSRFAVCVPMYVNIGAADLAKLRGLGIGVYCEMVTADGSRDLISLVDGRDLAFNAALPDLNTLKPKVRKLVAAFYEEFERGDWRRSFRDACTILEEKCRSRLLQNVKLGRAQYQRGGKLRTPNAKEVNRMTLGQIKEVFCGLVAQNQIEANICKALTKLNPLRIRITHRPSSAATERRLRAEAGSSMWTIINSLGALI